MIRSHHTGTDDISIVWTAGCVSVVSTHHNGCQVLMFTAACEPLDIRPGTIPGMNDESSCP